MQDQLPFRAGILNIMKYSVEVKEGVVHERTSTDYELDLYVGGNRTMEINGSRYDIEAGSVVFRRPGDHTLASGSYNCYTLTLDFSGQKKPLYGKYDRNDPANSVQEKSNNALLELIPSHFMTANLSEYIQIYDRLCYQFGNVDSAGADTVLLNRLFFLVLSNVCHTLYSSVEESRDSRVLTETCKYIQENFHCDISIKELADNVSFSPSYFFKVFKRLANTTPAEYLISVRLSNAKLLLLESDLAVAQVAERCGFHDASYFSYYFKKNFGIAPSEYRLTQKRIN
ncbi:MAG: helix-turn-helix transcriptional regulator [Clostridia bacterium]|nr:helix-turn-helix transcriptional regulator [Clostridia bacterium]